MCGVSVVPKTCNQLYVDRSCYHRRDHHGRTWPGKMHPFGGSSCPSAPSTHARRAAGAVPCTPTTESRNFLETPCVPSGNGQARHSDKRICDENPPHTPRGVFSWSL